MEKSTIADPIIIPEIVISEHLERPSSASSDSWNSTTSFTLPSQSRAEARSHHGIEFAEFELPPPLPHRPKPMPRTETRSAEAQLPPPIPSRSMLRTVCNEPLHETECSSTLPVPTSTSSCHKNPAPIVAAGPNGGRAGDALTINQVRSHLPHSFYAPPPSAREMGMTKVPTSYYAPAAEVVRERGGAVGTKNVAQGHLRVVRSNRGRQEARAERARSCCGCHRTKTRVLFGLRVINCIVAAVIVGFGIYVPVDVKLGQAGMVVAVLALIFNILVLIVCCTHRNSPPHHRTYIYTLIALDFAFPVTLIVLSMVSLVTGLTTNTPSSWEIYTYGKYESVHQLKVPHSGMREEFMGSMWMVAGLVEGLCWGVGAMGIWG